MLRRLFLFAPVLPAVLASCVAPPVDAPPPRAVSDGIPIPPPPPPPPIRRSALGEVVSPDVTPGEWRYAASGSTSSATYLSATNFRMFRIECSLDSRRIVIKVNKPGRPPITIKASTMLKTFEAVDTPSASEFQVSARDPILDAMAFSRGKFTVENSASNLTLPAWPEVARVVEDCRA